MFFQRRKGGMVMWHGGRLPFAGRRLSGLFPFAKKSSPHPDFDAVALRGADKVVELLFPYRQQVHTLTTNNGSEFACHQRIAQALGTTVYSAYASWQKGAIENMKKLVRQYLPKGIALAG